MSKSLGNLVFVGDLLKEWEPAAVRLALLAHHYRDDWEWTDDDMPRGRADASRPGGPLAAGARRPRPRPIAASTLVRSRLDDDLDTPGALAALDDEAADGRPVVRGAALLGVTL